MAGQGELLDLSADIFRELLDRLFPEDIKQLRLVSKTMCDVVSPFLMSRAHIAARRGALDVFDKILLHPIFSQTVKEVVYNCSQFRDRRESYRYLAHSAKPEPIQIEDEIFASLEKAARGMPQLKFLVLTSWQRIIQSTRHEWHKEKGPVGWDTKEGLEPTGGIYIPLAKIFSALAGSSVQHFVQTPMCFDDALDLHVLMDQLRDPTNKKYTDKVFQFTRGLQSYNGTTAINLGDRWDFTLYRQY